MQAAEGKFSESEIHAQIATLSGLDEEISLLGALTILARRWRSMIAIAIVCGLIAWIVASLLPNRFTAYTAILPPQQSGSTGAAMLAQLGGPVASALMAGGNVGLRNSNDLQVALLRSWTVEDAVIGRFHLMSVYRAKILTQARTKLERNVDIDNGGSDGLIRLYVVDRDPKRAAAIANGYVEEFKKATAHLVVTEASQRRAFFEAQLADARDNLASAEEVWKETQQKTGLLEPNSQMGAVIASLAGLRAQIAAKEVQIEAMKSFATHANPDMEVAEQELAALRAQQGKMGSGAESNADALLVSKGPMPQLDLVYYRKLRNVKYYETIFDLLARQLEAAKVDEARQGTTVQVVDTAIVPDMRSSPKPLRMTAFGVVAGIFLGILWAILAEGFARLSRDPVELARLHLLRAAFAGAHKRRRQTL